MSNAEAISNQIAAELGDTEAGVFFDNGSSFRVVARTTKTKPPKRRNIQLPGPNSGGKKYEVSIEFLGGSPRNIKAIEGILDNQASRLARQIEGVRSLSHDPVLGEIVIDIRADEAARSKATEKLDAGGKISGIPARINLVNYDVSDLSLKSSNRLYDNQMLTGSHCTIAFAGSHTALGRGAITARHCVDPKSLEPGQLATLYGKDGATVVKYSNYLIDYDVTSRKYHDLAFLYINSPDPSFVTESILEVGGPPIKITQGRIALVGDYTCQAGGTTGWSCGTVKSVTSAPLDPATGRQGSYCESVGGCALAYLKIQGTNLKCAPGDSGAPLVTRGAATASTSYEAGIGVSSSRGGYNNVCEVLWASKIGYLKSTLAVALVVHK